ncbi:MAG: hypothetical protein ACTSXW_07570 [Candidatus Baldrarchaeia archaeon]
MSRSLEDILVELRVEMERRFSDVVLDCFPIFHHPVLWLSCVLYWWIRVFGCLLESKWEV